MGTINEKVNHGFLRIVIACVTLSILTLCGGGCSHSSSEERTIKEEPSKEEHNPMPGNEAGFEPWEGEWVSECRKFVSNNASEINRISIEGNMITRRAESFIDNNCQHLIMSSVIEYEMEVTGKDENKISFSFIDTFHKITFHVDYLVDMANEQKTHGFNDWSRDIPKRIADHKKKEYSQIVLKSENEMEFAGVNLKRVLP